jgi:hypothetical protein
MKCFFCQKEFEREDLKDAFFLDSDHKFPILVCQKCLDGFKQKDPFNE